MDDDHAQNDGPMHPDNGKLGVFTNPLPPSQPWRCIGMVSTTSCLNNYFSNSHG